MVCLGNMFMATLHKGDNDDDDDDDDDGGGDDDDDDDDDDNDDDGNVPLPVFSVISAILSLQYVWLIIMFLIGLWIQIITHVCPRIHLFTPVYITSKTCSDTGKSKERF